MKFEPKIYKLGKLRIVLVKEQRESVTVRAIIGTGSREESDIEAGSAHFLEHFVFKGTKEFPGVFDLKEAIETVGGDFNAYTGQNEMGFWVKLDKNNLPLAIKIVGQITTSPLLPSEHFDKERETILEELYMYEDMPNSKAAETMVSTLYGNTNLGRPIIGTVESLKGMTVTSLKAYFDKWFVPENIIIGVVGDYGTEDQVL
jgi:predicted Zn-dependent peptidase